MANGEGEKSTLTVGHGIGLSVGVAVFSVVITIAGMTVYLGGWLRQIEVNAARLDRLETLGSPVVKSFSVELDAAIKRINNIDEKIRDLPVKDATTATEIIDLKRSIAAMHDEFRSREFWERLAADIAKTSVQIEQLNAVKERSAQELAVIAQRIATLEANAAMLRNPRP